MTSKILNTFKQRIKGLTLVPGSGGCFEVTVDGDLVYSKLKTGRVYLDPEGEKLAGGLIRARRVDYDEVNRLYG